MKQDLYKLKEKNNLNKLTESVQHMSDKSDDFEKNRKEINILKEKVRNLKRRVEILEKESDGWEQCSRRNCILVHGIEESKDEITNDLVVNF